MLHSRILTCAHTSLQLRAPDPHPVCPPGVRASHGHCAQQSPHVHSPRTFEVQYETKHTTNNNIKHTNINTQQHNSTQTHEHALRGSMY
jgi:hypothetical protein